MFGLSVSENFFYGGILIMILAVFCFIFCFTVFYLTGRKLRKKLEQEYGTLK